MRYLDQQAVRQALPWDRLIAAIRSAFAEGCVLPPRTVHTLQVPAEPDASLLLMPAWQNGRSIVLKVATVVPGNTMRGLPTVDAVVLAFDGRDGSLRAVLDGGEVTARRTAAASALVADSLARKDVTHLL